MSIASPFNIHSWIENNRHLLKPPVGNEQLYRLNDDFIVMIVGGPNARKDFHYDEGEELFYQLEGDIELKVFLDGKIQTIPIKQGDMFLLPPRVPHCPVRPANTVGLVIERYRKPPEKDGCIWYCENCMNILHEKYFELSDIVKELPLIMQSFYENLELRTCNMCGTVMEPPKKVS